MVTYIVLSIAILINSTIHEFTKGYTSYKLGDNTVKNEGKLTLNPLAHFEPIGFLLFLFTGYGWANPTNTSSLFYKNRKKGVILTYSLPILANLIFSFIFLKCYYILPNVGQFKSLFYYLFINGVNMAVFNLIPIPPLCGHKILNVVLSPNAAFKYSQFEKVAQILFIVLLISGIFVYPLNFISSIVKQIFLLLA